MRANEYNQAGVVFSVWEEHRYLLNHHPPNSSNLHSQHFARGKTNVHDYKGCCTALNNMAFSIIVHTEILFLLQP